jgi:hypothetical protein
MKYFLIILVATIMFSCSTNVSNDIKSKADSLKADSLRLNSLNMDSLKTATMDSLKITNIKK